MSSLLATSHREYITLQEVPRDYRTEIPNIINEMKKADLISNSDFILYYHYRKIAGENGGCWIGTRGLEKETGLSDKTITKSKKVLSQKFDILGGKSLIQIIPGDRKKEEADTVIITDIWPENFMFFKKRLTCSKLDDRGVVNETTGVSEIRRHKNEPYKKEPINKKSIEGCGNVHNSSHQEVPPDKSKSIPQSQPNSINSIPFQRKDFSISDSSQELVELLKYETEYIKYFRPEIVSRWIKKFGPSTLLKSVKFFFEVKKNQKKPIPNPEAWMEAALKNQYVEINEACQANKSFAENLKKKLSLRSLKINKRYCQDTETGKDFYYHLPHENFKRYLEELYGN